MGPWVRVSTQVLLCEVDARTRLGSGAVARVGALELEVFESRRTFDQKFRAVSGAPSPVANGPNAWNYLDRVPSLPG